jgi:hypothetical protein
MYPSIPFERNQFLRQQEWTQSLQVQRQRLLLMVKKLQTIISTSSLQDGLPNWIG